ncbi:hypothetical protein JCM10213_000616 [Rhodosporidiobolus nylandii]
MSVLTSSMNVEEMMQFFLSNLEPGQNPYTLIRHSLVETLQPTPPRYRNALLYGACAINTISPLLLTVGLIIRWRNRSLWLFRLNERYILPHYVNSWSMFLLAMGVALQGPIWVSLKNDGRQKMALWELLTCALISPDPADCIHLKTFSARTIWPWYSSAAFLNTAGIVWPLAHIVVAVVLATRSSRHYEKGLALFFYIYSGLEQAETAWTGDTDVDALRDAVPIGQAFLDEWRGFVHWFTTTCWFYGATGIFMGALLVTFAILYIRALHAQATLATDADCTVYSSFRRTRRWLVVVTVSFACVFTLLISNFMWIAALGDAVFTSRRINTVGVVLPFYLLGLSCIPVFVILLHCAIHDPASSHTRDVLKTSHFASSSDLPPPQDAVQHHTQHVASSWSRFQFGSIRPGPDNRKVSRAGRTLVSAAFENLELQVAGCNAGLDDGTSSIGKNDDLRLEELPSPAAATTAGWEEKTLRSLGKCGRKHQRSSSASSAARPRTNALSGVTVTRDRVTVVTLPGEEERLREDELKREKELYAALW